ncbi:ABC transporter substrate-binding protein [Maridesulfovibrio zosterae]|uniref:ABC transporter substrate-binding protein n=1 Tax=Maridesulfovibrio zosterae TaxID=82171 RepID=UPI00041F4D70|nr:ABC transporter substrate binding protein [Maridesulfovibrio zosterae]
MNKLGTIGLNFVLIILSICSFAYASKENVKKILIIHSYSLKNICGSPQHQGVVEALAKHGFIDGKNIDILSYAMDTKKVNNTPELIRKEADKVLSEIDQLKPDVVVLLDDNAFATVGLDLLDTGVSVVFSGMNGQPEDYNLKKKWMNSRNRPGHNITGVYEKLHIAEAFRVQKMILPDLKKAMIISDASPTGVAVMKQIDIELRGIDTGIEVATASTSSWEEYIDTIHSVCNDPEIGTIYPVATVLKDKNGNSYSTSEIIIWTAKNCLKPGIPVNYSFARLGMLGGAGVDFIFMGSQAGNMVARILKGTPPGNIPIEDAQRYALVFNLKRAKELGLEIPSDVLMAADVIYNN